MMLPALYWKLRWPDFVLHRAKCNKYLLGVLPSWLVARLQNNSGKYQGAMAFIYLGIIMEYRWISYDMGLDIVFSKKCYIKYLLNLIFPRQPRETLKTNPIDCLLN